MTHEMGDTVADFLTGDFGVEIRHVRPVEEGNLRTRWEWEWEWEWEWPAKSSRGSVELLQTGLCILIQKSYRRDKFYDRL
jgi:hypothetical protein